MRRNTNQRNHRSGFGGRLAMLFDFPAEALPGGMEFELKNDSDVFVSGCTGIAEYAPERVVLSGARMRLVVSGADFELFTFADGRVRIAGKVSLIEIIRGDSRD